MEPGSGTDGETAIVVNISQQQDDQEKPGKKVKIKPGNPPAGREGKKSKCKRDRRDIPVLPQPIISA
ncbi:MAG: hypothetical protein WDO19_18650 [Bacteroidota bacterium]